MARIDDEIQNTRNGSGNLLEAWEQIRGAERWMAFNGLISYDGQGHAVPTGEFTQAKFQGENAVASPEMVCAVVNAMNQIESELTQAGFAPFYQLRS